MKKIKKFLLPMIVMLTFIGCEKTDINIENNSPLVGTTYKSMGEDWESFSFSNDRYERINPLWQEAGIQWLGYYALQGDTIYCYYDKLPLSVEFTMIYCIDSIIDDGRVYYKQ